MMNSNKNHNKYTDSFNINRLALLIAGHLALGAGAISAQAREYFNPALLEIGNPHQGSTDLSVFEEGGGQQPGVYRVDIYVNEQQFDTRDVEFNMQKDASGNEHLQPCLNVALLNEMGIKTANFPGLSNAEMKCADLSAVPQLSANFRFSAQQLLIGVPQAALAQKPRGYVAESQWDNGIPALLLNYSLSGSNNYARNSEARDGNSQYANLRPGVNLGPWRLRNYTTWNRDSSGQDKWDTVYTYVQRSVIGLKSLVTLGDSSSPSDVFDSIPFRGGQMASDDDMLPDSLKGYAPVVRGIARTNAQVLIRQNGYVIYQSYVAPGAFEITDMYPTGGSGDLLVTIKEADGSMQQFVVPFASLPVLQREGRVRYSLTGGQYRSYDSQVDNTPFGQGTLIYGLPAGVTAYGGGQWASNYQSLAAGVGKNLGDFGAISTDVTQAWSTMQDKPQDNGQSWRVRYSKNVIQTGTNFAIAGYRYSTDGYYSLQEVMDTYRGGDRAPVVERRRNRSELTLSQNLWQNAGSVSLSWVSEDYWNSNRTMRSVGGGYNNSWNSISFGLNYSYNENSTASRSSNGDSGGKRVYERDNVFSFNISVPLDRFLPRTFASNNLNTSKHGHTTNTVGLNGTTLTDNNLNWNIQQGYGSQGTGNTGNINADYRGTYAEVTAGYAYDRNSQNVNYGVQGGVIVHENGITMGQPLGETIALVQAPGASGVSITNQTGVKTDWRGYAIVPFTSPYRSNQIQLNTETLSDHIDLDLTDQKVVPTRGAVVRATFVTRVGQRAMMTLLRRDGTPVPFGAMVSDTTQKNTQGFIVGDNGQVYLTGLAPDGTLEVKWGTEGKQSCHLDYVLPEPDTMSGMVISTGQCR